MDVRRHDLAAKASTAVTALRMSALRGFRHLALWLVRLYHPRLAAAGPPAPEGPRIVVANHPNGLVDPLVLQLALGTPLAFLGKATLFSSALGRFAMDAFDAIPVARRQDSRAADDEDAAAARNASMFMACAALLRRGRDVALFPEGISHDEPGLMPLRTGAARIALLAAAELGAHAPLYIWPVGLLYRSKATFRSEVSALAAPAIDVQAFAAAHGYGPDAVRQLTAVIADGLRSVVLEAESKAMADGLRLVAALTSPGGDAAAVHRRAMELGEAYRRLQRGDPAAALRLLEQSQVLLAMADELGLLASEDERAALALERSAGGLRRFVVATTSLLLQAPLAGVGLLCNWPAWRAVGLTSTWLARGEDDVISTYKLLGGLIFFPIGWLLAGGAAAASGAGWTGAVAATAVAALSAPLALRFAERLDVRRRALRAGWLRLFRADAAFALAARRRELAAAVQLALAPAEPEPNGADGRRARRAAAADGPDR